MNVRRFLCSIAMVFPPAILLCSAPCFAQQQPQRFIVIADDFSRGSSGWLPAFADYNLQDNVPRRIAEIRTLPSYIDSSRYGYYLQGFNGSDDLFSFLKKPLTPEDGIEPNATYEVEFFVEFASNSTHSFGLGGSPGLDVYLKVGASATEPVSTLTGQRLTFSLDKGDQSESGKDATLAGIVGVSIPECDSDKAPFVIAEKRQTHKSRVTVAQSGSLWLFVGTDSGYEGLNQLYYSRIVVTITRLEGGAR